MDRPQEIPDRPLQPDHPPGPRPKWETDDAKDKARECFDSLGMIPDENGNRGSYSVREWINENHDLCDYSAAIVLAARPELPSVEPLRELVKELRAEFVREYWERFL